MPSGYTPAENGPLPETGHHPSPVAYGKSSGSADTIRIRFRGHTRHRSMGKPLINRRRFHGRSLDDPVERHAADDDPGRDRDHRRAGRSAAWLSHRLWSPHSYPCRPALPSRSWPSPSVIESVASAAIASARSWSPTRFSAVSWAMMASILSRNVDYNACPYAKSANVTPGQNGIAAERADQVDGFPGARSVYCLARNT